jgi:hypothetical protein
MWEHFVYFMWYEWRSEGEGEGELEMSIMNFHLCCMWVCIRAGELAREA